MMETEFIARIVDLALQEDLGVNGDITSEHTLNNETIAFSINAREDLIVCGLPIIEELFKRDSASIRYNFHKCDGDHIAADVTIISGTASSNSLLRIERVALNFLQHASGIASLTRDYVRRIEGTKAKIRDTRKTTPALRLLEKYATNIGGAESYRTGLYDKILIKDNHIASCGGIKTAISRVREGMPDAFIAIECDTLDQVQEALEQKAQMILLDNMDLDRISKAVNITNNQAILEASGGINLHNVRAIAESGVDYISVGRITHSAANKDIGLDLSFWTQ